MELNVIETTGHSYLQVPMEDFLIHASPKLVKEISRFSGVTKSYVYLEEDCDAPLFIAYLKNLGINYALFTFQRPSFCCSKNFNSKKAELINKLRVCS